MGSVNIASSPEMLKTFQRNVCRARDSGLDVGIISAKETIDLLPWASEDSLYGAFHLPGDGHIDPHTTTYAVAKAATNLGAQILTNTRVTGMELSSKGEIHKVITDKGDIECEIIVNAAGIWSAQVAAMAGVSIPCTPVVHQHIAMEAVVGSEIPADSPTFRNYDYLVYGRPEGGSYLVGGWEMHPNAIWIDGVPWSHGSSEVPNDFDLFAPMLEDTIKRFPYMSAKNIEIRAMPVFAQRVTYVGELGWELYIPKEKVIFVWDRLWTAGQDYGIRPCGFKTIDSLRLEKGFLALTSDITPLETPFEARLGHFVKMKQDNDFIGKKALVSLKKQGIKQRLHTLIIGDEEYLTLYGGEAVILDGKTISRLRSTGYGHTVKKNIGFAYLPTDCIKNETKLMVEVFGEKILAKIAPDVLYDPESRAIRR